MQPRKFFFFQSNSEDVPFWYGSSSHLLKVEIPHFLLEIFSAQGTLSAQTPVSKGKGILFNNAILEVCVQRKQRYTQEEEWEEVIKKGAILHAMWLKGQGDGKDQSLWIIISINPSFPYHSYIFLSFPITLLMLKLQTRVQTGPTIETLLVPLYITQWRQVTSNRAFLRYEWQKEVEPLDSKSKRLLHI